jgi:hypothetical protein
VADAAAELVGEGAPYAFASFEAIGKFNDIDEFAAGRRWAPADSDAAGIRRAELPAPNSVISFRDLTGT